MMASTACNVMVDLETLGNVPGSTILSIGAVVFYPTGGIGSEFHEVISRQSCKEAGLVEDSATLVWWNDQPLEVSQPLFDKADDVNKSSSIGGCLFRFKAWLGCLREDWDSLRVWGNGSFYDLALLEAARVKTGHYSLWPKHADRCYRTLKNMRPNIPIVKEGLQHDALQDATNQAYHAIKLLTAINGWE